jgi:hypothetical protein
MVPLVVNGCTIDAAARRALAVREPIAALLRECSTERALAQYVQILAGGADLQGVDVASTTGPLVR